jgi:hypothetical protein
MQGDDVRESASTVRQTKYRSRTDEDRPSKCSL